MSAFPFEIQHHGVTSVYIWFAPFKLGGGAEVECTPLQVFLSLFPQISTYQLQIFCVWFFTVETCSDKKWGRLWEAVDTFSPYLYRIFSSYFFSFLTYLVLIEWKEKHPVGHLSLSKHSNLANLLLTSALLKKYRILIIFLAFFNPEFNNCMIQLAIFVIKWWWITFEHLKKSDKNTGN